jgi:Phosphodiester glycosidase
MLVLLLLVSACRAYVPPASPTPQSTTFPIDSQHTRAIAPGVTHRTLFVARGPWVVQVLDVQLDGCNTAVAVKGGASAIGRTKTSELLTDLARTRRVVGGVNADFFLFTPPGVPTGLHVNDGRVLTPPSPRPAFAMDSAGRPHIGFFTVAPAEQQTFSVDDAALRTLSLLPFHPREAVGGRPILTRDSTLLDIVDTEGQASFAQTRHPRTAVGIAARGTRLLLVLIDGRQPGWSAGMTLVYADPALKGLWHIANRPSDPTGERAVGNALAIVQGCERR